ncbi:MAG: 6-carboxytetrahydropterin synthase, partial [Marinirhabdus sp.]|nr:6-carboxytetrahydropterin synthase [Marinirhabdus sp.]
LNEEVPEFKNLNPTVENIAVVIYDKLRAKLDARYDISVTLYETPRNFVVYTGK